MKLSESFFMTRKENPSDEYSDSAQLLIKSGMIYKNSNGLYSYLPIGLKVINNIKKIIREELKSINSEELLLSTLIDNSKEKNNSKEIFNIIDKNNNKYKLSHSSIELFSDLVRHKINSYKNLHFSLFQINNKYRDEKKNELGIVRTKEYRECESYSFDSDEGGLDVSYDKMFLIFKNIFTRLSLNIMVVRTNENVFSEEFQVISKYGDNKIVKCKSCGYTSNIEDAIIKVKDNDREFTYKKLELINTKNITNIKELSNYLDVFESNILKSVIFRVNNIYKLALLRGNSELNLEKLKQIYNTDNIEIPNKEDLIKFNIPYNNIGPINCKMEIIADNDVKNMHNFICGSNKLNYHYKNANIKRDFRVNRYEDIKLFNEDNLCPLCRSKCDILNGIEVGQISKLDHNISKYYDISYTNEKNEKEYVLIGSYHIGIDRCLNAIVEENHDELGIIWPMAISPYKVAIIVTNMNHDKMCDEAEKLYNKLLQNNIETIYDDRKVSVGIKLNDMDLIGIPIRITIGNNIENDLVEIKLRNKQDIKEIKINNVIDYIEEMILEYNRN